MAHNPTTRLDSVLTMCAAIAVVAATATVSLASSHRKTNYQPGDRFAVVRGLDLSRSSATVVAFVRSTCGQCIKSGDSLKQISATPRSFQFVVVGYETLDKLNTFVRTEGIKADAVFTADKDSILFSGVPRVAILDRNGVVKVVWSGSQEITSAVADVLAAARPVGRGTAVVRR